MQTFYVSTTSRHCGVTLNGNCHLCWNFSAGDHMGLCGGGGGAWRKDILVGTRTGGCTQALLEKSGIESSPDIFSLTKNRNVYNFCWCVWFENCVHLSNTRMFFDVLIIPSCFFIRVFTTVALKCGLGTHGLSYMNPGMVVMLQMSCNEHRSPQV